MMTELNGKGGTMSRVEDNAKLLESFPATIFGNSEQIGNKLENLKLAVLKDISKSLAVIADNHNKFDREGDDGK